MIERNGHLQDGFLLTNTKRAPDHPILFQYYPNAQALERCADERATVGRHVREARALHAEAGLIQVSR